MAVRIQETTKVDLVAVPVPSYFKGTALSHKFIMNYMESKLTEAGITIESESYRSTADGGVAQCVYKLDKNRMVAWTNSYIQGMRFKSGSGIYLKGDTYMIGDTEPDLIRSIDVDERVKQEMDDVISNLDATVLSTVKNLKGMKSHTINSLKQAEILGALFADSKILTSEQAAGVAKMIKRGNDVSLSAFYNEVAIVLKRSHPRNWMDSQRALYNYFLELETNLSKLATEMAKVQPIDTLEIDPAQINMLDQIEEVEMNRSTDNEMEDMPTSLAPQPDIVEIESSATTGRTVDEQEQHTGVQSHQGDMHNTGGAITGMPTADIVEVGPPMEGGETCVDKVPTGVQSSHESDAGIDDQSYDDQSGAPELDIVDTPTPSHGSTVEGGSNSDLDEPGFAEMEVEVKSPQGPVFSFDVDEEEDVELDL